MKKKILLIVCAVVLLLPAVSFSAWVDVGGGISIDPFHVAVRDYNTWDPPANANGIYEKGNGDHVRYGFNMCDTDTGLPVTDTSNYFTVVNGPTNGELTGSETRYQVQGYLSQGSYNHGDTSYTPETYYRSRFRPDDPSTINHVDLYRNDAGVDTWIAETPNVTLPNASQMRPYSGPDMNSLGVSFDASTDNWDFTWTPVAEPTWDSSYRFTLWGHGLDDDYEIIRSFDAGVDGVSIADSLLNVEDGTIMWAIQMQERFVNEGGGNNWNWLRSYSVRVDFSQEGGLGPVPTPIPASVWMLASGILGLVGIRRKYAKS